MLALLFLLHRENGDFSILMKDSLCVHQGVVIFGGQLIPPSTESGFCCMQRRYALEDWLGRLLADIVISRSASMASFLELEAAARFGKQTAQMLCILWR